MSFVYAFKFENCIYMIGDTKVTIDDTRGVENFKDMRRLVEEYGTLKTIILSDDIALGFSGNNLGHVDSAIKDILESVSTHKNIVDILREYSEEEKNAPDFILAYKNELIYLISNGIVEERDNCFIGSPKVFNELQKRRDNQPINPKTILPIIQNLIKENIDNGVGGFSIELIYTPFEKRFVYKDKLDSTITKERYIPSGGFLPIVDNAEDGGFTYILSHIHKEGTYYYPTIQLAQNKKTYAYVPIFFTPIHSDCIYKYLFLPFDISNIA